jgi:hypothetical protein
MDGISPGDVVVVHCREPREKVWGLLLQLDGVGVCVRGMDLGSVEDWIRQQATGGEQLLGPSTFLVPLHRVQRVDLDEVTVGGVAGFAQRYLAACGRPVSEALCPPPTAGDLQ